MFQNDLFIAHRRNPRFMRHTIELNRGAHVDHLHANNDRIARSLGLIHAGDRLFIVQNGNEFESVMQDVEAVLAAFDEAQNATA